MPTLIALVSLFLLLSVGAAWAAKAGSRSSMEARLQALQQAPAPAMKMGAMCYDMVGPAERAEYVCPTCGERTVYARDGDGFAVIHAQSQIEGCRRLMDRLKKASPVPVVWDESAWCKHCSPDAKTPAAFLVFTYEEGEHREPVKGSEDLVILCEFFEGERGHKTVTDGVEPLKNYAKRLEELLGVAAVQEPSDD